MDARHSHLSSGIRSCSFFSTLSINKLQRWQPPSADLCRSRIVWCFCLKKSIVSVPKSLVYSSNAFSLNSLEHIPQRTSSGASPEILDAGEDTGLCWESVDERRGK